MTGTLSSQRPRPSAPTSTDRIAEKTADGVAFNLHLAVENCIDIAAHVISENGWGVPGSASEMFYLLEGRGMLDLQLTERMVKAVGLRNLIVHEYGAIDLDRLFVTVRRDLGDLTAFLSAVFEKTGITA